MTTASHALRWTLWAPLAAWLMLGLSRIIPAEGMAIALIAAALSVLSLVMPNISVQCRARNCRHRSWHSHADRFRW
jgi:hypothetical protein